MTLQAVEAGSTAPARIELTPKGQWYCHEHGRGVAYVSNSAKVGYVANSPRAAIEAEVERLISILDALDGDADLEPYLADCTEDREFDDGENGIADLEALQVFEVEAFTLRFGGRQVVL